MTVRTRVMLADDHPIVLAGLRNLVTAEADFDLIGEATTGLAALKLIREMQPEVALVDISMPELNGIALVRRVTAECPSVKTVILTLHEDRAYLKQALDAGVRGYVLKRSAAEGMVPAIRAVLVGSLYVDPVVAERMFNGARRGGGHGPGNAAAGGLTARETEVLRFAAHGLTNKEIARKLAIGIKSVETYKARGAEKLGLKTRADIVRYAAAQEWLADT